MATSTKLAIAAMICITLLEMMALSKGINGTIFTIVVGILAGLGGYLLPQPKGIK